MTMLTLQATVEPDGRLTVNADDATHEIERLEARVKEVEASMVSHFQREHLEGDGPEIDRWKARVREVETVRDQLSQALSVRDHQYKVIEQERDRLAEKVRELEGELPGKLKGERALADEQIRCFHERAVNAEQERDRLIRRVKELESAAG